MTQSDIQIFINRHSFIEISGKRVMTVESVTRLLALIKDKSDSQKEATLAWEKKMIEGQERLIEKSKETKKLFAITSSSELKFTQIPVAKGEIREGDEMSERGTWAWRWKDMIGALRTLKVGESSHKSVLFKDFALDSHSRTVAFYNYTKILKKAGYILVENKVFTLLKEIPENLTSSRVQYEGRVLAALPVVSKEEEVVGFPKDNLTELKQENQNEDGRNTLL